MKNKATTPKNVCACLISRLLWFAACVWTPKKISELDILRLVAAFFDFVKRLYSWKKAIIKKYLNRKCLFVFPLSACKPDNSKWLVTPMGSIQSLYFD